MSTVTFAVITRNEEHQLGDCLASAAWADEILVVDSYSSDRTVDVALKFTQRVYQHEFVSFAQQRNKALDLASGEWVLFVDADERVTAALAAEIRDVLNATGIKACGFWIPRHNFIWGKRIAHGGWYPDYQLRLLQKGKARYDESRKVHELVNLDGTSEHLVNPLIHYNYSSIRQFLAKQRIYSTLEAETLYEKGVRVKPHNFVLQPIRAFRRRYWQLEGYRDGAHGLLLSLLLAYYELVTYIKLLALQRARS